MCEKDHQPVVHQEYIPGLQALLCKTRGKNLILESYTASNFLPSGSNCGTVILKVDAVIRRKKKKKKSKSQELHMVAKMPPLVKWQRDLFNSPESFKKEAYMYETILPAYKEFESKCGINKKDIINIAPAFYGSRLNLVWGDVFDVDALIILENLKHRGYYTGDRYKGLDIDHLRILVKAVARFHAIGIAIKIKNPDFFEELKVKSKPNSGQAPEGALEVAKVVQKSIKEDPAISKYYGICSNFFELGDGKTDSTVVPEEPDEPWSTIIHNDLWINNVWFHRNEESGPPDDVKFLDFQDYVIRSSGRDFSYMLGMLSDHEVSTNYIPELINLYYDTLVSRLEIMGCDVSPFSRNKFDRQLAKDASLEFPHIAFMLKVTTRIEKPNNEKSESLMADLLNNVSDDFVTRMRDLVTGWAKRGWLKQRRR